MILTAERETGRNKCMLIDALRYLRLGWSVMPLKPGSKEPLLASWTKYQTELPTTTELTEWFTEHPNANLAILTGAQSNLGIVDADGESGFQSLRTMGLRSPLVSMTGKGRQLFFRHPGGKLSNAVRKYPGIDIRGDGGYVVAPPSLHPNGKRYTWLGNVNVTLPMFPVGAFVQPTGLVSKIGKPSGWISEALKGLVNGNRNDTFASVVGKLHRDRWTADDIRSLLLPHAMRCEFPEKELDTVIWSITRKPVEISGRGGPAPVQPGVQSTPVKLREFGTDDGEYQRRKAGNKHLEFRTGYPRLDAITSGPQRGELLIVGARTETGKTNLLLGCSYGLCETGKRVLLLSTEMSFDRIWDRYLALGPSAKTHAFIVCDDFATDIGRIREALTLSKADLFIFDHINVIGDDHETISRFLKGLKELAREFNIPGIVAAQLNRQAEWKDQEGAKVAPALTHLKGSGTIEEVAAQVLLLTVVEDDEDKKYIQGIVAKNRYGEKGNIDFVLKKKPYSMEEL